MDYPFREAGQILQGWRKAGAQTQLAVAESLQVTRRAVKHWESGSRRPRRTQEALLGFLEIPLQDAIRCRRVWSGMPLDRTQQERSREGINPEDLYAELSCPDPD